MAVFVRKLFGIGKLPAGLRAQVAVTRRFSGVIPGLRASRSVGSYVGSLAFTSQRVLGTLSVVPKLAGRAIDVRWDQISSTGLQLELDVADVDQKFSGQLSLHYKDAIPDEVLTRLPRRSLAFDVPPEYVFRVVGVIYSPSRGRRTLRSRE